MNKQKLRILIAEHAPTTGDILLLTAQYAMEAEGYTVEPLLVNRSVDALRELKHNYDVVLTDWVWPPDTDPEGDEIQRLGREIARIAKKQGVIVGVVTHVKTAAEEAEADPNVDFVIHWQDLRDGHQELVENMQNALAKQHEAAHANPAGGTSVKAHGETSGPGAGPLNGGSSKVFIVYGHCPDDLSSLIRLIEDFGLDALTFDEARERTQARMQGSERPVSTYDIVTEATSNVGAVLVLNTGDEDVREKGKRVFRRQARPNVMFEAGLAFARLPTKTVVVKVGEVSEWSDLDGIQYLRLSNSARDKERLRRWFETAGFELDPYRDSWRRRRYKFSS